VVALVQRPGLLLGEGVGERVAPLLKGEAGSLLAPDRPQYREGRLELRERHHGHPLGGGRVECHAYRAVPAIQHELGEHPAGGVAHQDRRPLQPANHVGEVVDDGGHGQVLDRGRVGVQASTSTSKPG
jgi:hypothetical protein